MGGTSQATIQALRFHVNNGNVHVHDDAKSLKFECSKKSFETQIDDALKILTKDDGIVRITGSKDDLLIIKDGKKFNVCVVANKDMKPELQAFLKEVKSN